jgi:hypothetical protein
MYMEPKIGAKTALEWRIVHKTDEHDKSLTAPLRLPVTS